VEKEQTEIAAMSEKVYRRFARNCQTSRANLDKSVSKPILIRDFEVVSGRLEWGGGPGRSPRSEVLLLSFS
jgi:hypothetical protein